MHASKKDLENCHRTGKKKQVFDHENIAYQKKKRPYLNEQ